MKEPKRKITFNGEEAAYTEKDGKIYFELKNIVAAMNTRAGTRIVFQ